MQQSITTEKIVLLACITAGCGVSLYIINQYGNSLLHWLTSFYHKISVDKQNNSASNNDLSSTPIENPRPNVKIEKSSMTQHNSNSIIIPQITAETLNQSTAHYLQKKDAQTKGTTDLHIACENNAVETVKLLLQTENIDVNAKRDKKFHHTWNGDRQRYDTQEQGETPLHIACQNNNKEIIEILLARNDIDITIQKKDGDTSLHIVCKIGNQEIVQKLLTRDASIINTQNNKKETALYLSYFYKHKAIFSLLSNQENIDLTNLLSLACKRHDMNIITQLLNHKNIKLDNSRPLYTACKKGYSDIVLLLLTHNKNNCMRINDKYHNSLIIACKKIKQSNSDRIKFVTIIKALLDDPAIDINTKIEDGFTVFHFVASDYQLLQLLLNKDSRFISERDTLPSGCPDYMNKTPLHNAIEAGNLEAIFLLLQYGANISVKDCCGYTPLALACKKASEESLIWSMFKGTTYKNIVEQLLQSSYVNQEIINSSKCLYKLDLAKTDNSISKLLLSYGADPNKIADKCGDSPLLQVAKYNLPLLNLFIDQYKGDITQKDHNNQTVLYKAFMAKNIKTPNEINFFKNLNENEKNAFMTRELSIIADFTPKNIFSGRPLNPMFKHDSKEVNDLIKLFNFFITTCISYGKITNNKTLLDTAYEKLQKRHESFYSSDKYDKHCMHSDEGICRYTHDTYHYKSHASGCDDCRRFFPYNELIVHGLIQHVSPTTTEQAIDQTIARTYKEGPAEYYLKQSQEKENQKKCLREQIIILNSH
jgi:ankyrin repeat protein